MAGEVAQWRLVRMRRVRGLRVLRRLKRLGRSALRTLATLATFLLAMAAVVLAIAGAAIYFGLVNVSGTAQSPPAARLLFEFALQRAVHEQAQHVVAPPLDGIDRLTRGAARYRTSCEPCHRGPGVERSEIANVLNPAPADLSLTAGRWTPAEIFWIVKNGIRMSGMPAWGSIYSDEELWDVAALVHRLPRMSASEYAELERAAGPPR